MTCESLEDRVLLAATYTFEDGVLNVTGTHGSDKIGVFVSSYLSGSQIGLELNGRQIDLVTELEPVPPIDEVIIRSGGGDDQIEVLQVFHGAAVTIRSGAGDDRVLLDGSDGFPANVHAGDGDDRVRVTDTLSASSASHWEGAVRLRGGAGHDSIKLDAVKVEGGDDLVSATLRGGEGDDRLSGGASADLLEGEDGDDTLSGGGGNDRLLGGAGNDMLKGSGGSDTLKGGSGMDRFFAGSGDDTLYVSKGEKYDPGKGKDKILR